MDDGASVEGISRLLGKWFTKDHTKLSILAAADDGGGDDTTERKWWWDMVLLPDSKGLFHELCAINWLYMSCLRMKVLKNK